ncbi:MAG: Uma2 family endonuclease [Candidatus Freyarchaeota archaeon]
MQIEVVTGDGKRAGFPFLVRFGGWTEEKYFAEAPEDRFWEFQDGEVIVHSPASSLHQRITRFLTFLINGYVEEKGLGEVFNGPAVLRLREGMDKEPDIFFISRERRENVKAMYVEGPADLVIEVSSESTRTYDLEEKSRVYREGGVKEYWVVDPERKKITIHLPEEIKVRERGKVFSVAIPGFWIDAEWLWQEPLPAALSCLREILKV